MSKISEDTKNRIDAWIKTRDLNPFGDAKGTHYAGGNPCFDERGGPTQDRYEYILSRHPELRDNK